MTLLLVELTAKALLSAWWYSDFRSSVELNGALEAQHEAMDDNLVYEYIVYSAYAKMSPNHTNQELL